jgi:hypothetical protein
MHIRPSVPQFSIDGRRESDAGRNLRAALHRRSCCGATIDVGTPVQFTFHGIGTALYGERDYWPDGSFVTTEWAVLAWIPIFPTFSKRISCAQTSPYAVYDASGYYVHETTAPNLKQVLCVYGWFASLIAIFVAFGKFQDVLTKIVGDEDKAAGLWFLILGALMVLPYALRRWAKRCKAKEWERCRLGLGPPTT